MSTLAEHWSALATSALLGTDRRPLPPPPAGPIADLVVDGASNGPPERLLDAVAMLGAMRRGGLLPGEPAAALPLLAEDTRAECPPAAVDRLHRIVHEWPHLLGEWVALASDNGWRLPADAVVLLLTRRGVPPEVRSAVAEQAGPLIAWLGEVLPAEFGPQRLRARQTPKQASTAAGAKAGAPAEPAVPLPAGIAPLPDEDPDAYAARLARALAQATVRHMHRPALVRVVSALPRPFLLPLAEALARAATHPETMGLVVSLTELALFRWDLSQELTP